MKWENHVHDPYLGDPLGGGNGVHEMPLEDSIVSTGDDMKPT